MAPKKAEIEGKKMEEAQSSTPEWSHSPALDACAAGDFWRELAGAHGGCRTGRAADSDAEPLRAGSVLVWRAREPGRRAQAWAPSGGARSAERGSGVGAARALGGLSERQRPQAVRGSNRAQDGAALCADAERAQLTPTSAAPAPEALALEGSMPTEPAPGADTALPDLPPPELQQVEAGAGSEKQVGAPGAAPTDGAGAQCLITEETVGTSGGPDELLLTGSGSQKAVATDLTDDLLPTDDDVDILKKAHDLTMSMVARSRKQAEELKTLARDRKELEALRMRLDDEKTENPLRM
ncbi:uncharacterized protein LOC112873051 [Panicum hallii]|uniref:uncharacterized protein LOC112873051 n=1 Tax=Panicum hallii TaxID=206008 RepID=UPI000DF4EC52|nr:uncharacterized protein LOC112873051 [Panicum hallii]